MKKEIYLIRHGQTDYNLKGIVQGKGINSLLNDKGHHQAGKFFEYYQNEPFEAVYTSTLTRTLETVQPFLDAGFKHIISDHLDEIDWGIYEGQEPTPKMQEDYMNIINLWKNGDVETKIHGGESAMELFIRQQPFINEMRETPFNKILVCSHGRAIRSLLCGFLDVPLKEMENFDHTNTCLYKLIYDGDVFTLELANDIRHLNE